ncbi:MAG: 50S ribosomal protein L10 [Actinobacteria bacterium]|jgi:large subunit ribosomal protein L10|nr:50S ribosomal protein L10 [Actinomycetota bacterium]
MARPDKTAAVAELAQSFRDSDAAVLTEYRGLTVAQLKQLRRDLAANASYIVAKNTLTKRAAKDAGIDGLDELLVGPSAIAFVSGDAVETAKGIRDFAKTNPLLVIKGGIFEGKVISADDVKKLANLESREVLLSKMAGAMLASLTKAAYLFNAPLAQAARAIDALRVKAESDPSVLNGAAPAAPVAAAAPVAEAAPVVEEAAPAAEATSEVSAVDAAESNNSAADAAEQTEG